MKYLEILKLIRITLSFNINNYNLNKLNLLASALTVLFLLQFLGLRKASTKYTELCENLSSQIALCHQKDRYASTQNCPHMFLGTSLYYVGIKTEN